MMEKILKESGVRMIKDKFCLNDIVTKLIGSKNPIRYSKQIKEREVIDGVCYIDHKTTKKLIFASRSNKCKNIVKKVKETDPNNTKLLRNSSKQLIYMKTPIDYGIVAGEVWFRGKDIACILGYNDTNYSIRAHVDDEDRNTYEKLYCNTETIARGKTPGSIVPCDKNKTTVYINESGLYSLIFGSKLQAAKEFKRWVTKDVLPSLRVNGYYDVNENRSNIPTLFNDIKKFNKVNALYIFYVKDNLYKYGITTNMNRRAKDHMNGLGKIEYGSKFVKVFEMGNYNLCKQAESDLKMYAKQKGIECQYNAQTDEIYRGKDMIARGKTKGVGFEFFEANKSDILNVLKEIKGIVDTHENNKPMNISYVNNESENTLKYSLVHRLLDMKTPMTDIMRIIGHDSVLPIENDPDEENNEDDTEEQVFVEYKSEKPKFHNGNMKRSNECAKCNEPITRKGKLCNFCSGKEQFERNKEVNIPSYDQLVEDKKTMLNKDIAKKYNVTEARVSTWIKMYAKYENDTENIVKIRPQSKTNKKCIDCGNQVFKTAKRCNSCNNKHRFISNTKRPTYKQLQSDMKSMPMTKIGIKYGVSDNAVRKWLRCYKKYTQ